MLYLYTFLFTIFIIISFYYIAPYFKLIDFPDKRKIHSGNIPLVGGISIYLTLLFIILFIDLDVKIITVILSSGILVIIGAIDDALEIGVLVRLISQLIAGLIILATGLSIIDLGTYFNLEPVNLGIFGFLLTIVCVMGLTNSINFIDGIDGLCSSIVIIALLSLICFISLGNNTNIIDYSFLLLLIVSIGVFIIFNIGIIPNKKIFLGDAGSMLLGFLISWLLIYYSHPSHRYIHPSLVIWVVTLPVFDLLSVIIRRLLREINPIKSDRRHIHHILLDLGLNHKIVLTILICLSIFLNSIGALIFILFGPFVSLVAFFIFLLIYIRFSVILSRKIKY